MKRCPICGSHAAESAGTCFECLYHFDTLSTEDVSRLETYAAPPDTAWRQPEEAVVPGPDPEEQFEPVAFPELPPEQDLCPEPSAQTEVSVSAPSPLRSFSVEVRCGTAEPHVICIRKGSLYVGRGLFNDLVVDEELVVRRHAHLYRLEQGIFMELLSSAATATINGASANHISLIRDEDVVSLGSCDLVIRCA